MGTRGRRQIVLATRSTGKIRELAEIVEAAGFEAVSLDALGLFEEPDEDAIEAFETFEDNALAKARWFVARAGGRVVLADDSGLAVHALGGAPGVRSKRWAAGSGLTGVALDAANNERLVRELEPHAMRAMRAAKYVCVTAIAWPDGAVHARGECTGVIVADARGAGGFGYDPHFLSDELGMTFAEATVEAKERVSHRGRAVRAVLESFGSARRRWQS